MNKEAIIAKIYEQIETVYDPEIPVDINALGLIYKVEIDDEGFNRISIQIQLIAWCCENQSQFTNH